MDISRFKGLNQWLVFNLVEDLDSNSGMTQEEIMAENGIRSIEELANYVELGKIMDATYGKVDVEQINSFGAKEVWADEIEGSITIFMSKIKGLVDVLEREI